MADKNIYTEKTIQDCLWHELIRKQHSYIIPNTTMFYRAESDLISITKTNYINEYEIKIDKNDLKNDHKKKKFRIYNNEKYHKNNSYYCKPNYFWYVMPIDLYDSVKLEEMNLQSYAGIMVVDNSKIYTKNKPKIIHKEKIDNNAKESLSKGLMYRYWNIRINANENIG